MDRNRLKLFVFGVAFVLLLVQNALLVRAKKAAEEEVTVLQSQLLELRKGMAEGGD